MGRGWIFFLVLGKMAEEAPFHFPRSDWESLICGDEHERIFLLDRLTLLFFFRLGSKAEMWAMFGFGTGAANVKAALHELRDQARDQARDQVRDQVVAFTVGAKVKLRLQMLADPIPCPCEVRQHYCLRVCDMAVKDGSPEVGMATLRELQDLTRQLDPPRHVSVQDPSRETKLLVQTIGPQYVALIGSRLPVEFILH